MIVCSCNVLSADVVHCALGVGGCVARVSDVYARMGCRPQCGRCAPTIRQLMREAASIHAETCPATFDDVGVIEPMLEELVLRAAE